VGSQEVVERTIETASQFIAISTYSGIALSYARRLLESLESHHLSVPIFMGGLLKENQGDDVLAVDVSKQLKGLGIICCSSADQILREIKTRI
jgi:methylmalonyl-CoA mutase cobalamin-binding subunit